MLNDLTPQINVCYNQVVLPNRQASERSATMRTKIGAVLLAATMAVWPAGGWCPPSPTFLLTTFPAAGRPADVRNRWDLP